ncbi:DUF429 domain-containing protein [Thermodesulfobacteriota bacterium]
MIIAGVDGCPAGWLCITKNVDTGRIRAETYPSARALIAQTPRPEIIAIDIPIGLTDRGPRECDKAARVYLKEPRRRSVFPTPIRPALYASSREEASEKNHEADGRRIGVQTWAIVPKIRQVDEVLRNHPELQSVIREVHPEVSFAAWNNDQPMRHSKKKPQGRNERMALVEGTYGQTIFTDIRSKYLVRQVGHDDIWDAFAALWTAERIFAGCAQTLPPNPPKDSEGHSMEMVY